MTDPHDPARLVADLYAADVNQRALALAALVRRGPAATAAVQAALQQERDEPVRALLAQALAEIADPAAADTLAALVTDGSESVRAHAAQGLALLHDPRALDSLVRTIDDGEDLLRTPYTLSVDHLIDLGAAALPAVAPLLASPRTLTRERAFTVVHDVVQQHPELGAWAELWRRLGAYDARGHEAARAPVAQRWAAWLAGIGP